LFIFKNLLFYFSFLAIFIQELIETDEATAATYETVLNW